MVLYMYDKITGKDLPPIEIETVITENSITTENNTMSYKKTWIIPEEVLESYSLN